MLYCHSARVQCEFVKLMKKIDHQTGKTIENELKYLRSKEAAIVKINPLNPIFVEKFSDYPSLGRFIICNTGNLIVIGIVKDAEKRFFAIGGQATGSKRIQK